MWSRVHAIVMAAGIALASPLLIAPPAPLQAAADNTASTAELLVGFRRSLTAAEGIAIYGGLGARHLQILEPLPIHRLAVAVARLDETVRTLSRHPDVEFVERNHMNAIETTATVPGELLVDVDPGALGASARNALGGRAADTPEPVGRTTVQRVRVRDVAATAGEIAQIPGVRSVELQRRHEPTAVPDDSGYSQQWHLGKISAPRAWDLTQGAADIVIAIVDTGVDATHPDLAAKIVRGYNFYDGNTNTSDVHGHGTKVAGAAAAIGDNHLGVAGVAWESRIMPLRVSDANGNAMTSAMASAVTWAADHGARVVNISFAGVAASATVTSAARYANSKGTVVIAGAGNCGCVESINDNPYVVSVSATDSYDRLASFSSRGSYVDVAAPGVGIYTTVRGGTYGSVSGTSFSGPITAGVAALMLSANPALTPGDIAALLRGNADDLGTSGWDEGFGFGRVNAYRAVVAALSSKSVVPAPSADAVPPGNVQGFTATDPKLGDRLSLSWHVSSSDTTGTVLLRRAGSPVTEAPVAGRAYRVGEMVGGSAIVYAGAQQQALDLGLSKGTTYYYKAFAFDTALNYASGAVTSGTPSASSQTGTCPAEIVLDNLAAGRTSTQVSYTGQWRASSNAGWYGANGSLYSSAPGSSYTWRSPLLSSTTSCTYEIAVWWVAGPTRATSVPVTIGGHSGGRTTQLLNQQGSGGQWHVQGVFLFAAGAQAVVTVTDAHGQASADAVRLRRTTSAVGPIAAAPKTITMDNGAGGAQAAGSWCRSSAPEPFGAFSLYSCGSSTDTYRWAPTVPATQTYDVYVWWTEHPNRSKAVPITVTHTAGVAKRSFDQRSGGGAWHLHGRYTFGAGTVGNVKVDGSHGQAAADAVRFVPVTVTAASND